MRTGTIPLIICLWLACGCASLFRGNTQEVRIDSYPPGASGEVDGMSIQTPARLMLTRNEPHTVVLRKEGYLVYRTEIAKNFEWSPFVGDLICWKLFRSKELSAGAWRLEPESIYARLEIEEASMEELLERTKILFIQSSEPEESSTDSADAGTAILLPAVFRVTEHAEVFTAPDICHKSLGTLYAGATIVVLEQKGNWYRQSCTQFVDGWILKSVVSPR
jgi:PEGA domain